jgi:ABC-type nickel/cobalt efflux system permease component RcnA
MFKVLEHINRNISAQIESFATMKNTFFLWATNFSLSVFNTFFSFDNIIDYFQKTVTLILTVLSLFIAWKTLQKKRIELKIEKEKLRDLQDEDL